MGLRRFLAVAMAVGLGGLVTLGSSGPSAASAPTQPANGAESVGASATLEPPDDSGITFTAFRSFGLPIVPGQPFYLSVVKTVPTGPLHFAEVVDGVETFIGVPDFQPGGTVNGVPQSIANWLIEDPTEATHTYLAIFEATEEYAEIRLSLEVVVARAVMTITIGTATNPIQTNQEVILYPELAGGGTGSALTGDFEWRNADSGALLATRPADDSFLSFGSLPVGTYHFTIRYTGDPERAPVTSPVFELRVTDNVVEAQGVGVQYTTFYPVADGYRDTVGIKGNRLESASVAIRVLSSTGTTVRTATVAAGTGAYSYAWNGRTSAGSLLAAGKYKVVQTLTDGLGSKLSVTSNVTLSHGKLVTKTAYVTKDGSAISAKGSGSGGAVTTSTASGGYAKLASGGSGWAIAGWEFSIPGAFIYKSVAIEVYAQAGFSVPPTALGIQNFESCARTSEWNESCFDRWATVGTSPASLRWYSTSPSSAAAYRSGSFVRGIVTVDSGTVLVYEARAKVVYQVLEGGVTIGRAVVRR